MRKGREPERTNEAEEKAVPKRRLGVTGGMVLLATGVLLVAFILTGIFLAAGSLLSRYFAVTVFEATISVTVVTIALAWMGYLLLSWGAQSSEEEVEYDEDGMPICPDCGSPLVPVSSGSRTHNERELLRLEPRVGRNVPCPCGSGKKFKHCHGKSPQQ